MNRRAVGAVTAQGVQALASFVLQIAVAHTLGLAGLGAFAIIYGVVVLASGVITGFVGDSLVVLDRRAETVRSALQQASVALAVVTGAMAGVGAGLAGLVTPLGGVLLGLATAVFCLEEVVRRTLMAHLLFWRVAAIDACGLAFALLIVAVTAATTTPLTLNVYLLALAAGQALAIGAGILLLPKEERRLVRIRGGARRTVVQYGAWRSMQQFLRPALLTAVRSAVGVAAGLTATGLLEAARVYTAPALLLVGGLSSYLFASYAEARTGGRGLERADRAVALLLVLTAGIGAVALLLLPVAGTLLFGRTPDVTAVIGWLIYTASVAAATPYGALAAVSGRQALVFGIRASDTAISLAAVLVGLALGASSAWAPALLAIGSLLGGLALRRIASAASRRADDSSGSAASSRAAVRPS